MNCRYSKLTPLLTTDCSVGSVDQTVGTDFYDKTLMNDTTDLNDEELLLETNHYHSNNNFVIQYNIKDENKNYKRAVRRLKDGVDYINPEEEDQMEIYGFRPNFVRTIITWFFIFISGGLLQLMFNWKPQWMLFCTHSRCPLKSAKKVLLIDQFSQIFIENVRQLTSKQLKYQKTLQKECMEVDVNWKCDPGQSPPKSNGAFKPIKSLIYFENKRVRYIWDNEAKEFSKFRGLDSDIFCSYFYQQKGLTLDEQHRRHLFRRTRSLNAPSPNYQFGPCGRVMKNSTMVMTIQDPASQRLTWNKPPLSVLVIKKIHDSLVIQPFIDLVRWLNRDKKMSVYVEAAVMEDPQLKNNPLFIPFKDQLCTFKEGKDDLTDKVDFIICLGGDGTLLYASSLFQQSVPPVMAFHMGSLGFLTPFEFDNFQEQVSNVLEGHAALTLRSRLRCQIVRKNETISSIEKVSKQNNLHLVLNELVIDRGPSPYLSNIDLYIDGKHITTVMGDGLIVSTPTGSTAYAVAAGASMIHPSVPAIMVTPICPHSLSFRPIVVPAGVELKICVSPDSRNSAWVSFDGRNRQEIQLEDSLKVTTSIYPVPSICAEDQIADWFDSLAECLHWNVRRKQRQFDEFSDLLHSSSNDSLDKQNYDSIES